MDAKQITLADMLNASAIPPAWVSGIWAIYPVPSTNRGFDEYFEVIGRHFH